FVCFFFQAEDGIRDFHVTGVQTCALPISGAGGLGGRPGRSPVELVGGAVRRRGLGRDGGRRHRDGTPRSARARRGGVASAGLPRSEERRGGEGWRTGGAAAQ